MADTSPAPTSGKTLERMKNSAAVIGALTAAVTGLWGVYEKVRSEARAYTASSYNTLAPQVNQMGEVLKQMQQENQQLRELVAKFQGQPRIAAEPPRRPAGGRRPASSARPAEPTAPPTAGAPATPPPAAAEPTPTTPAPPPTAAGTPPAETKPADPVTGLIETVGRTREAIEALRRVPEDFENVVGKKK